MTHEEFEQAARNTGTAKSRRQCQRRLCSRPISICNGESGDYEEVRRLQYRGKLSFAGWSQSLHKIPGDRGGLSEW